MSRQSKSFTPREIFNGALGELPLLLGISLGFYGVQTDPRKAHLRYFESGMLLFAFQRAAQRRVLLHDSYGRTLSLPLSSPLAFTVKGREKERTMTLAQIVHTMPLPVAVNFAQKDNLQFFVKGTVNHRFFGRLTVVSLYQEPFLCCLPIGWKTRRTGCTFAVSAEQNRFVSGDQHGGAQKSTRKTG
ncbi:hypothetical protein C0Q70_07805 [Pomacea canaliculata]|uniref:Uncharacterized protein n=1 Tax=Pomacea canaliculata TaxID=400727 RepID=A0A2T7PG48_POMCA|nr:hypothetical protein C0Q70_07805 [Pomacea canaliculata]